MQLKGTKEMQLAAITGMSDTIKPYAAHNATPNQMDSKNQSDKSFVEFVLYDLMS
jgi:hypothetical protein